MIARLALLWLVALASFCWGVATVGFQVFPFRYVIEVVQFARGGLGEEAGVVDKLKNDLGITPARMMYTYDHEASGTALAPLEVPGLKDRRDPPLIYMSPDAPRGYRMLFGAFDFDETFWGGLLIGPDGELVRTWALSTDDLPRNREPDVRKNMYGIDMQSDGSIIFGMNEDGGGIVSVDACGRRNWVREGVYHHAASLDGRGGLWTFEGDQGIFDHILLRLDAQTGEPLERIDMAEVRAANPDTYIFDLQRLPDVWDRVHGNDIEELTPARAAAFPGFDPGDLLLSYRVPNLIFVLDPRTLKIKWWRVGPWDTQHDPDWGEDGRIWVFSNNKRWPEHHSKIVAIDPQFFATQVVLRGEDYDFYSSINGNQEVTPNGGILVTSSTQGRVFEVDAAGRVVFDFVNSYDAGDHQALHMAEAMFLPLDFFGAGLPACD